VAEPWRLANKVDYFAQYATMIDPEDMPRTVLEEVDFLLDYLQPTCAAIAHKIFCTSKSLGIWAGSRVSSARKRRGERGTLRSSDHESHGPGHVSVPWP
jgi:hypothetical protein